MANLVWHTKLGIHLDLTLEDLGHPNLPNLWSIVYDTDRLYAARDIPVSARDLQCGGICQEAGVTAWMYLRQRADGRREAVHERAEDEQRHVPLITPEHRAYQERIVRAAESGGFRADCEVRTRTGRRNWIQTDTLVCGEDGLRIGWEVQLSSAGAHGPRSVRARASHAARHGITPAWHTDRADYADRHDTHWTRSDRLPARVIAKTGDLRVVSGFRALDFWRCDTRALYRCPDTSHRCGKVHVTPKPRDILFDDLVRQTAANLVVPVQHNTGSRTHRFWVTRADSDRLNDLTNGNSSLPPGPKDGAQPSGASRRPPTCRPRRAAAGQPVSDQSTWQASIADTAQVLDWRSAEHWSFEPQLCRHCRRATNLLDDQGEPSHKVCAEAFNSNTDS
ncbi:hypothetical protein ACFY94_26075 [Streptomyces griseorubiginosus]|uniref:hypothetical protein n=1 Tax=Streptomyces griseorubiginosus TaxID=67304 RepID=UPI0036E4978D